jgi:hypothetical protein
MLGSFTSKYNFKHYEANAMIISSSIAHALVSLRIRFRIDWLVPEQPLDDHHLSMKIISAVQTESVQT